MQRQLGRSGSDYDRQIDEMMDCLIRGEDTGPEDFPPGKITGLRIAAMPLGQDDQIDKDVRWERIDVESRESC